MRPRTMLLSVATATAASLIAVALLGALSGCATDSELRNTPAQPIMETTTLKISGQQVVGIQLLHANGTPFCFTYRAEHGLVVCPHFDLTALGKAGVAAAMSRNWKTNGLEGEIDAKVEKVNSLAAEKGVRPGMTVREALGKMMR